MLQSAICLEHVSTDILPQTSTGRAEPRGSRFRQRTAHTLLVSGRMVPAHHRPRSRIRPGDKSNCEPLTTDKLALRQTQPQQTLPALRRLRYTARHGAGSRRSTREDRPQHREQRRQQRQCLHPADNVLQRHYAQERHTQRSLPLLQSSTKQQYLNTAHNSRLRPRHLLEQRISPPTTASADPYFGVGVAGWAADAVESAAYY
jgi:hypothetical protein